MKKLERDIIKQDKEINEAELRVLFSLESEIENLEKEIKKLKTSIEALKAFNLIEVTQEDLPKNRELKVLEEMLESYKKITNYMIDITKKIIEFKRMVDEEAI